jgi:hypothetical protein
MWAVPSGSVIGGRAAGGVRGRGVRGERASRARGVRGERRIPPLWHHLYQAYSAGTVFMLLRAQCRLA